MPINRPDGRHWCAPEREKPSEDGTWTCPDDGQVWYATDTGVGGVVWTRTGEPRPTEPVAADDDAKDEEATDGR